MGKRNTGPISRAMIQRASGSRVLQVEGSARIFWAPWWPLGSFSYYSWETIIRNGLPCSSAREGVWGWGMNRRSLAAFECFWEPLLRGKKGWYDLNSLFFNVLSLGDPRFEY